MAASLGEVLFWLSVASCAIAQSAIIYSVSSSRGPAPTDGMRRARPAIEVLWAALPGIVLVLIFTLSYRAMHPLARPAIPGAIPETEAGSPA